MWILGLNAAFLLGGMCGVFVMCLCFIAKGSDNQEVTS
ncbi:DUF3789 domain-containing protein [Pseudomonas sp.]